MPALAKPKSKKPMAGLSLLNRPAVVGSPARFVVRARAVKGRRVVKFTLAFGDGTKALRGTRPRTPLLHTYKKTGTFTAKLTVLDNRRRTAIARLKIRVAPARATIPPSLFTPPSAASTPTPLDIDAAAMVLVTGSAALVELPAPVEAVAQIDAVPHLDSDLAVSTEDGAVSIAVRAGAVAHATSLTILGKACTNAGCGHPLTLRVPVSVRGLPAPAMEMDRFTQPSPDRAAAAKHIPGVAGGTTLQDELVITLGTPDAPGTRAQADSAAALAEGVVSSGINSIGVFEVRWPEPQDLEARRAQLMAADNVVAVSDTHLGLISADATPPGDWSDDGDQVKWPFEKTRAVQAWDQSKGSDIKVGIVDEGQVFASHEDLNVVGKVGSDPLQYHATHVAGTACARANGKGVVGFAWGCPIVTSGNGDGSDKALLEAVNAVGKAGAKVINISMGYGTCSDNPGDQQRYLDLAHNYYEPFRHYLRGDGKNIVLTASAGNNCHRGVASPWGLSSDLGNVITVAAINSDKRLAWFSSFGRGVELAAPGGRHIESGGTVAIWSTLFEHCMLRVFRCDSYGYIDENGVLLEGTSMAAPAVAGIVALVRSRHPNFGASRAAGCVVGHAGEVVGSVTERSTVGIPKKPNGSTMALPVEYSGSIPIVNAQAAVECRSLQFNGSAGTGPPPSTLGGHTMTSFGIDDRPLGELVSSIPDPAGTIALNPALEHLRVADGWATWSHGYTGDVYFSGEAAGGQDPKIEMSLPPGTEAFAFYAEPNTFSSFSVEAIASDGTSSEPVNIAGQSGARFFGFHGTDGQTLSTVTVTASDPLGFGIGEFSISR